MEPLLRLQDSYISKHIMSRSKSHLKRTLNVRHNYIRRKPDPRVKEYLEAADFGLITEVGNFDIDTHLITAMVERWRPETHTFHLPYGECTITLEYIELELGLPIRGNVVTGPTYSPVHYLQICGELLGVEPPIEATLGSSLSLSWLRKTFAKLPNDAPDVVVQQYARAYMMQLIGGIMMPDKSGLRVNMMYLPLLQDLSKVPKYSWGSATLAFLYRQLCKATLPDKQGNYSRQIGGCMMLLQSWIWHHIPHLAPRTQPLSDVDVLLHAKGFPLARKWSGKNKETTDIPSHSVTYYRLCLDHLNIHQFKWNPYPHMMELKGLRTDSTLHWAVTPLICFHIIEWHQVDRALRQLGMVQTIPSSPKNLDVLHKITLRNKNNVCWQDVHKAYIQTWEEGRSSACPAMPFCGEGLLTIDNSMYMRWYTDMTIRWLCPRSGDSRMEDLARQILRKTKTRDVNAFDDIDHLCMEVLAQCMEDQGEQPPPIKKKHQRPRENALEDVEMASELVRQQGYTSFQDIPPYYHKGFPNDPDIHEIIESSLIFPYQENVMLAPSGYSQPPYNDFLPGHLYSQLEDTMFVCTSSQSQDNCFPYTSRHIASATVNGDDNGDEEDGEEKEGTEE